jgi:hypothetical protein
MATEFFVCTGFKVQSHTPPPASHTHTVNTIEILINMLKYVPSTLKGQSVIATSVFGLLN